MCFIRVLFPHPCFNPSPVFYPLIRILFSYPCCIPSFVFYTAFMFYHLIRVLSAHPCLIPSSVIYPPIRVLSPYLRFIPSSVSVPSVPVFYPNPFFTHPVCLIASGMHSRTTRRKLSKYISCQILISHLQGVSIQSRPLK